MILRDKSLLELVIFKTPKKNFYLRSDKPVSGLCLPMVSQSPTLFEFSNQLLNQKIIG